MRFSQENIKKFQNEILSWYEIHKRDLPWREIPEGISLQQRAYRILISEVMSQQTQIQRVIVKYQQWLEKFPTIEALSNATVAEVLASWSGLGYNRRALNLKKTAEIIVKEFGSEFPKDEKMLRSLPGIGEYTSRAIVCFAFSQQVTVIDTNVRKVILTRFQVEEKAIATVAEKLLPVGKASEWNQALMDYAAAMLKKEKIPIPKQSKFIGSHRYYRGQVLKTLLEKKRVYIDEIGRFIKKDYTDKEDVWLQKLLQELEREGFIQIKRDMIMLVS